MNLSYERVVLSPKTVAGLGLRTSNLSDSMTDDIGGLWNRFYSQAFERIPDKVTGRGIGLYHHYESDHLGAYDMMACCEVASTEQVPEGFATATIAGGPYARFVIYGDVQKDVAAFWQELWTLGLPRAYTTDFEEYICGPGGMQDMEIHIYIALDEEKQASPVCQCCGMSMNDEDLGTEADGGKNTAYCKHCYQNGAFTTCQSCGMPMDGQEWGTEADGRKSTEYCTYCYENGVFTTSPTLEGMIEQCLPFLMQGGPFEKEETARQAMRQYLPTLRRWKQAKK